MFVEFWVRTAIEYFNSPRLKGDEFNYDALSKKVANFFHILNANNNKNGNRILQSVVIKFILL